MMGSSPRLMDSMGLSILCLCVIMQLLGVPGTLLAPFTGADLLGSTVLEGLAIPQDMHLVMPSRLSVLQSMLETVRSTPLFEHLLFRPPSILG